MELEIEMEAKQQKLEKLQALVNGPLASSIAKLSGCSRTIPSEEDFHFYYNFGEFKDPVKQISQKSQSVLKTLGGSSLLTKQLVFPEDIDDAYDWLVDVNDQLFERFDVSIDEFRKRRKEQEEESENGGFQLVEGKKKKEQAKMTKASSSGAQKRVAFHIPSIPRPQDEYKIVVDNSNKPFEHVWLEKSEDGSRFIHPLEKFSELDFVDKIIGDLEPVKPLPIECTPFKIVEKVEELKELASKLGDVNEFAVDLEHNHYRSFQGLTCLMQISTRTEDFVVDTLKLRVHIGPYLRDIFKDPSKKKVMHGSDRDILWLQQDFSIYVCNMFDTGQASKILQLERNSLEFLLNHFCGITANKVYQNADWRLRPIPDEMLKYAREDTHYLLYIYDLMRVKLLEASIDDETGEARLAEVYKRSYAICMQLYEKEILTESSYLYIYGLHGADFNSQQVAIAAGLCEWRDTVARAEDESTGFILPNKALLDIARLMPLTSGKLRGLVKFKHPYVERNLGAVVSIIKRSIQNAPAYESAAELLKMDRTEMAAAMNMVVADESEVISAPEDPTVNQVHDQSEAHDDEDGNRIREQAAECVPTSAHVKEEQFDGTPSECGNSGPSSSFNILHRELSKESLDDSEQMGSSNKKTPVTEATIQVLKKPSRAFGALLGKSGSKKKLGLDSKAQIKVEQIKASVTFQFHSFPERSEQPERLTEEINKSPISPHPKGPVSPTADTNRLEEIIPLENDSEEEALDSAPTAAGDSSENSKTSELASSDHGGTPMSLTELSSNFEECVDTMNKKRNTGKNKKCQEPDILQLNPFDYSAARTQTVLGDQKEKRETKDDDVKNLQHLKDKRRKGSIIGGPGDEGTRDFPSVRRRQAFPNTGNRGATFR